MMKILIGHDGSQSADAALVDLQRAGLPVEAEALIVSVADVMMVPATPAYELAGEALMSRRVTAGLVHAQRQTERVLKEAKEFANRAKEQVRSYFPHWNVRAETLAGSAALELISKADEWRPDLIVVGSNGRSAVSRFILGSVSKKVVTDSDHSVRVSRGNLEKDLNEPLKLVIGVDASAEAEHEREDDNYQRRPCRIGRQIGDLPSLQVRKRTPVTKEARIEPRGHREVD